MDKDIDIRVAEIIKEGKIVINKGSIDNIEKYMEFVVYEEGDEITDPLTKKKLGRLENPKGIFKPIHIQEKMSVLITLLKRPSKLLSFSAFVEQDAEIELLKTIKIGDKVKVINAI